MLKTQNETEHLEQKYLGIIDRMKLDTLELRRNFFVYRKMNGKLKAQLHALEDKTEQMEKERTEREEIQLPKNSTEFEGPVLFNGSATTTLVVQNQINTQKTEVVRLEPQVSMISVGITAVPDIEDKGVVGYIPVDVSVEEKAFNTLMETIKSNMEAFQSNLKEIDLSISKLKHPSSSPVKFAHISFDINE
ncbi:hypothetical protein PCE1_004875 [Barthelona sp. PCE]